MLVVDVEFQDQHRMTGSSSFDLPFLDCSLADILLAFQIEYLPLMYPGTKPNISVISAKSHRTGGEAIR